ncbi:TonB-dependent receptor domain-containing protein [Methylotuvimicrobium alcaliphilum]|uniref:TonB-dependent receptor protein n=1 Tax=Methylotuvimicrobium alcaliphilum (strain DSM 19304 / NCIMB 14124 / VKM B-2133 / 20Z) TaxID=1091494 RepID=G4SYM9_META2|nr:TonB-dependent receptor [Methylotuvimicrobium alcaliphilum]CCE23215.1 TonB-dependent receptor protein [Methylotuvimicrobium alcaliphilum 20Z]
MRKNTARAVIKDGFALDGAIKKCLLGFVFMGTLVQVIPAQSADKARKIHFNIQANDLASALFAYSEATGIQMSYPQKMVSGIKSSPVSGDYTPDQALQKLLAGSNYTYQYMNDDTIKLVEAQKALSTKETTLTPMTVVGTASRESPSLTSPSITESQTKLNRVPGGTTVIDGARINEGAVLSVNDVFTNAPGVYVGDSSVGSAGGSRISIRGSDANSIISPIRGLKILRNGMPFTSANGTFDTQTFNLYAIDHVEVYRGANALEYGGSNLGGAINLITPTGYTAEGMRVGMKWGTYDYVNPTFSVGKVFDNGFDVYGSFSYLSTDTTRDNNKQEQFYGHGNVGYRWNENHETRLYFDIQKHNFTGLDPLTKQQVKDNPQQNTQSLFGPNWAFPNDFPLYRVDLKHSIQMDNGDSFEVGAYYGYKKFNFQWIRATPEDIWQDTGFNWRHEINGDLLGLKNRVVWGGLMQWMFIDDLDYATVNRRRGPLLAQERDEWKNIEVYLEDQLSLTDTFTLVAGIQINYRSVKYERTFGFSPSVATPYNKAHKDFFAPNPKLGFTWQATKEAQVFGNLSRSSEPPPLANLAHVFLKPPRDIQTASTVEIGTRGQTDFFNWDLAFYHSWVNNEYLIVSSPTDRSAFTATNADSTTLHTGIELGLESNLSLNLVTTGDELRLSGNYTWNNFRFDNDQNLGDNRIPGIPEHNARLEALYKHPGGFYIGPNAQIVSSNWVDFSNTLSAKSYALLGARAGWDDGKHWNLFIDARNLTNEHYASSVWVRGNAGGVDVPAFNPGGTRSVIGGVEYRF